MWCPHCGYKINEKKLEASSSSFALAEEVTENTKINYVCPQCGHLIHDELEEEEIKSLSRAAHAQMQRSRNHIATGMGSLSLAAILLVIAVMFFFLAKKPAEGHRLVTTCPEFYVSMTLFAITVILLLVGGFFLVKGLGKKITYSRLLKDINNRTFVQ